MTTPDLATAITPQPTSVREPGRWGGRVERTYITRWEIDQDHGADLVVQRTQDKSYRATFRPVAFQRGADGRVWLTLPDPLEALTWAVETAARYDARRLREINRATTAHLAEHLGATSPVHAEVLARASRAGALGAMNNAAAHLRATFPQAAARCATEATPGWTCLSITYPSGLARTHALRDDEAGCWQVSCYPDVVNDPPYYEQDDVADADLAATLEAHHRRTV